MKIVSTSWALILACMLFTALDANNQPFTTYRDPYEIDMEVFSFIKDELEAAKKTLIEIRDSQNPALASKAISSLNGLIKELAYIAGALTMGGGSVAVGLGVIIGGDNVRAMLKNPLAQGATLIALPAIIVSTIISYAFLKLLFGRLLATSVNDPHHINESLVMIDLTINKLNYEIRKVERFIQANKGS